MRLSARLNIAVVLSCLAVAALIAGVFVVAQRESSAVVDATPATRIHRPVGRLDVIASHTPAQSAIGVSRRLFDTSPVAVLTTNDREAQRVAIRSAEALGVPASPLILGAVLFSDPTDPGGLLEDGVGGGAIALPVFGMLGGYAVAGRGRRWTRYVAAVVPLLPIPIWALVATHVGGPEMALDTPNGAWVAVYFYSFVAVLAFACSIPHRRPPRRDPQP